MTKKDIKMKELTPKSNKSNTTIHIKVIYNNTHKKQHIIVIYLVLYSFHSLFHSYVNDGAFVGECLQFPNIVTNERRSVVGDRVKGLNGGKSHLL